MGIVKVVSRKTLGSWKPKRGSALVVWITLGDWLHGLSHSLIPWRWITLACHKQHSGSTDPSKCWFWLGRVEVQDVMHDCSALILVEQFYQRCRAPIVSRYLWVVVLTVRQQPLWIGRERGSQKVVMTVLQVRCARLSRMVCSNSLAISNSPFCSCSTVRVRTPFGTVQRHLTRHETRRNWGQYKVTIGREPVMVSN